MPVSPGHGAGAVHVAGLYAPPLAPNPPVALVPPLTTNARAPQIDAGFFAGYALIFATAMAGQGAHQPIDSLSAAPQQIDVSLTGYASVFPAAIASSAVASSEYQFGLHAQAIYEQNTTRVVWSPARSPLVAATYAPPMLVAAPQAYDFTLQGSVWPATQLEGMVPASEYHWGTHAQWLYEQNATRAIYAPAVPSAAPAYQPIRQLWAAPQSIDAPSSSIIWDPEPLPQNPGPYRPLSGAPQAFDFTLPALVWPAAVRPPVSLVRPLSAAPQPIDLTQQGSIKGTPLTFQGTVPALLSAYPVDPTQTSAQIYGPAKTQIIIPNPIAGFFVNQPQFEERATTIVWASVRSGQTPPRIGQIFASPVFDLTPLGFVTQSAPLARGLVRPILVTLPGDPTQIAGLVIPSVSLARGLVRALVLTTPVDPTQLSAVLFAPPTQGRPSLIVPVRGAPQSYDFSLLGMFAYPSSAPPTVTGITIPQLWAAPVTDVTLRPGLIFPSAMLGGTPPQPPPLDSQAIQALIEIFGQTEVQGAGQVFIEESALGVSIRYTFLGVPYVPEAVRYRVDDEVSDKNLVPWTSLTPAPVNFLIITSLQNPMVSFTRAWERHQVLFEITDADGAIHYANAIYYVIRASGLN